jgi:ribosomal protein S21
MAKETKPITYRVSEPVDKALRRLAKQFKGIDRALRHLLGLPEK